MKKTSEYTRLSLDDEISSIVYATLCSVDKIERTYGRFMYFHPLVFIVESLYNEKFEVLKDASFITRTGGARYVMNDVSSYRKAKDFDVPEVAHLKDLFSRYGCSSSVQIINFIYELYVIRDSDEFIADDAIRKALMAYRVYYKKNISLSFLPSFKTVLADYMQVLNSDASKDVSYASSLSNFNGSSSGNKAVNFEHLRYPEVKMMIVADGTGSVLDENVSYTFCDLMNEWFWKCHPYGSNFSSNLEYAIRDANNKIGANNPNFDTSSVSVFVCTKDRFYISSVGTTRVYLIKGNHLEKIDRTETLYDELRSKGNAFAFDSFMSDIPADSLGLGLTDPSKCDAQVLSIPSYDVDGVLMLTKSVYDNISEDELEKIVFANESTSVLEKISDSLSLERSSSLAIYQKKKRMKKGLFSTRKR